jgi:hypothetical protein
MNEMNGQSPSSRKIIIAIAMAVVVGIGTITFALRSHRPTAVAQTPDTASPVAQAPAIPGAAPQTPDAASPVAQTPAVAGAVPQTPDVPTSAAQRDRLRSTADNTAVPAAIEPKSAAVEPKPAAIEPKSAGNQRIAKAHTGVVTTHRTVSRPGSAVDASEKTAAATVASSVDGGKSVDAPTTPSAPSDMAPNAPEAAISTEPTAVSTEPVAPKSEPATSDIPASPPR